MDTEGVAPHVVEGIAEIVVRRVRFAPSEIVGVLQQPSLPAINGLFHLFAKLPLEELAGFDQRHHAQRGRRRAESVMRSWHWRPNAIVLAVGRAPPSALLELGFQQKGDAPPDGLMDLRSRWRRNVGRLRPYHRQWVRNSWGGLDSNSTGVFADVFADSAGVFADVFADRRSRNAQESRSDNDKTSAHGYVGFRFVAFNRYRPGAVFFTASTRHRDGAG